jgi:trafficking protein particle complex subunit 8
MTAITLLLLQTPLTQSKMTETLDPLLDSAIYSYTARSSSPYFSLRTTLISIELLSLRGGTAPDDAVKWASRALGTGHLGDIGTCLVVERIAACYKIMYPRRRRKMALWSMLACESWIGVGCKGFATRCLRDAWGVYKDCEGFGRIGGHVAGLMESLGVRKEGSGGEKEEEVVVDMHEEGTGEEGITVEFA